MNKTIEKILNDEFCSEHTDACPFFIEPSAYWFTMPFFDFKPHYGQVVACIKNSQVDWITKVADQNRIGKDILKVSLAEPKYFFDRYKKWRKDFDKFYKYCLKIKNGAIEGLSDKELTQIFVEYHDKLIQTGFAAFLDPFMFYGGVRFPVLIRKFCSKHKIDNLQEVVSILSAPTAKSFLYKQEEKLAKLSRLAKNKRINKERFSEEISKYLDEFFWLRGNYAGAKIYGLTEVLKEIRGFTGGEPDQARVHRKAKENLIAKWKFNKQILVLVKLIELFCQWQDDRKIYTLLHVAIDQKFLEEFSRRIKISLELLKYSYPQELIKIMNGKFSQTEFESQLKEREKGSVWFYERGETKAVLIAKEAEEIYHKLNQTNTHEEKTEFKGTPASMGKVRGNVVIITNEKDLNKIKQGDILVAPMTRPDYIAALKKASGIITDDGGITCHAAIISREMKKPCIIGTKIATKILKDGDLVEVDANQGVIKILKHN